MNTQEAIKELMSKAREITFGEDDNVYLSRKRTVELISQIHEPQKVVIPKFVAESFEKIKINLEDNIWSLVTSVTEKNEQALEFSTFERWFYENHNSIQTLINMKQFGYEIEQEKLFTVEIPNNGNLLVLACINHAMKLVDGNKHLPGKFTKESIEYAGFDWALKWAKTVEVE